MSFDFPAAPAENTIFTPEGGPTYVWHAPTWDVYDASVDSVYHDKTVRDFGAVGDGVVDDSDALEDFWDYIKASQTDPVEINMDWVTTKFVLPPGKYRVTRSIDWTMLKAWNVHIEANGALIMGEVNGKPVLDMLGCRGVHVHGLAVQAVSGFTPTSAFLIGPATGETCGNSRFEEIMTSGSYSIAAFHNIGSETTQYDYCGFQTGTPTAYAYAGDGDNTLGAVSDYVTIRAPGVHTSFTNNSFHSCRFSNYYQGAGTIAAVFVQSCSGWSFDKGCYYLAYDGACVLIRQADTASTNTSFIKIEGLFETAFAPSVKYAVKIVCPDGFFSATDGFELNVGKNIAAQTAVIRLETPSGAEMTTGLYSLRMAHIHAGKIVGYAAPTLFSGARMGFNGEIFCQNSDMIDLTNVVEMHGTIYTDSRALMTVGTQPLHAYTVYDNATASKQALSIGGSTGFATVKHGVITLPADPANPLEAATKQYVDAQATANTTTFVNATGDTMTGPLVMPNSGTAAATSINFGTADAGIYGNNLSVRISTVGVQRLAVTNSVVAAALPVGLPGSGTAAAVSLHFGTAGTGLYGAAATISAAISGVNAFTQDTRFTHATPVTIAIASVPNFANDAAAATGSVPVGGVYRNGSILMIRVA